MVKPNPVIVKAIQQYDKNLFVKWNNEDKWFEVWRTCRDGDHIITPVVEICYDIRGDNRKAAPLDYRIVKYLYSSDGQRKGFNRRWRWNGRSLFNQRKAWEKRQKYNWLKNAAKDCYNMANNELINPHVDESDYLRPDAKTASRVSMRTAENVREYRDELARND